MSVTHVYALTTSFFDELLDTSILKLVTHSKLEMAGDYSLGPVWFYLATVLVLYHSLSEMPPPCGHRPSTVWVEIIVCVSGYTSGIILLLHSPLNISAQGPVYNERGPFQILPTALSRRWLYGPAHLWFVCFAPWLKAYWWSPRRPGQRSLELGWVTASNLPRRLSSSLSSQYCHFTGIQYHLPLFTQFWTLKPRTIINF